MDGIGVHLTLSQGIGLGVVLLALVYLGRSIVVELTGGTPHTRMRRRLETVIAEDSPPAESTSDDVMLILKRGGGIPLQPHTRFGRWMTGLHMRVSVIGGRAGLVAFYGVPVVAAGALLAAQLVARPWSAITMALVTPAAAALIMVLVYRSLEQRFQKLFLRDFPDALELIVRAVRAGVPVAQAMQAAGQELSEPGRSEFKKMSDSLRLGADMGEVLREATSRIRVTDFNFFAVCILLQRETGGQLAETLENLARIIRARRDVRLKARALVAEGRAASKAIGAIPFLSLGFLSVFGEDYVDVLFSTETGRKLLLVAGGMLAIGYTVINRMSQLED